MTEVHAQRLLSADVAKNILRAASVAAVLLAGSCAAPTNDGTVFADGLRNHPITVTPQYESVRVAFSDSSAGLTPQDRTQLAGFVEDYVSRGDGAISITAPSGPDSSAALAYFGEQLAHMGVPRTRILVGTHDAANGDGKVEIGYIVYAAHTDTCGNWTQDAGDTAANLPMPDFGCSVQHNIAAMVADPRDLETPRGMGPADATRRQTVVTTYEKAQSTAATKSSSQSANLSDVGSGGGQ
ncbi:MAG TPA: CpaD family pilus assembly protein [Rhizomicrobium sp.]|jgi:pilus assembly protein CpaD|nr:CpaD family pilus assembly protein [Rhizomicrobium sp.]